MLDQIICCGLTRHMCGKFTPIEQADDLGMALRRNSCVSAGRLYDLNTPYGSKEELKNLLSALKEAGIKSVGDVVSHDPRLTLLIYARESYPANSSTASSKLDPICHRKSWGSFQVINHRCADQQSPDGTWNRFRYSSLYLYFSCQSFMPLVLIKIVHLETIWSPVLFS